MSLLLDALKKAADDKIKNTGNSAPHDAHAKNASDSSDSLQIDDHKPNEIQTDSLELELDLESEPMQPEQAETDITDSENETDKPLIEDFPEVDEAVITNTDKEKNSENKTDFIDEIKTTDLDDSPIELTDNISDLSEDDHIDEPNIPEEIIPSDTENQTKVDKSVADEAAEITEVPPDNKPDDSTPKKPSNNQAKQQSSGKIKNEQALSALINKSNQYTRSENLRKNITIGILITLILIGSGLYFYIEMQTTSQDLYIAQNSSEVNRQAISQNVTPAPTQPLVTPQQSIVKKANTTSQIKPVTKKPVVSKPRITQQTSKKQISIVRTKKQDPIHVLLRDAYTAFHNEDYRKSESLYQKVKKREPTNRDALLGLAAIGIKEKRFEYARQKYQFLLKLNPRDSLAIAGMSSIENRVDPQLNESQLKFMLKQQPDSAHLYFALGSQYSVQGKWAEAQSAFFSAWSAENKNADYAYNLAVSLDHLDKKKQALDFYQLSLKLKRASNGNFSNTDTEQRISTLQKAQQ